MCSSARAISSLSIPETDKAHLIEPVRPGSLEKPEIAALVRVIPFRQRAEDLRDGVNPSGELGLGRKVSYTPGLIVTHNRLLDEFSLIERLQPLHRDPSLLSGFGEQQISTAGSLSEAKILRPSIELV